MVLLALIAAALQRIEAILEKIKTMVTKITIIDYYKAAWYSMKYK